MEQELGSFLKPHFDLVGLDDSEDRAESEFGMIDYIAFRETRAHVIGFDGPTGINAEYGGFPARRTFR